MLAGTCDERFVIAALPVAIALHSGTKINITRLEQLRGDSVDLPASSKNPDIYNLATSSSKHSWTRH